nr:hypothetical protein [Tanacetum cinerariifolium]
RKNWGRSYNERFMALFIHEIDLEAKVSYVIWLGHVRGLEDDVEGLFDVLFKLESSLDVLVCPCVAAAKKEEKGNHVQVLFKKIKKIFGRGACKQLRIVWCLSWRFLIAKRLL